MALTQRFRRVEACLTPRSFVTWYTLSELLSCDWTQYGSGHLHDELEALRPLTPDLSHVRLTVICTPVNDAAPRHTRAGKPTNSVSRLNPTKETSMSEHPADPHFHE